MAGFETSTVIEGKTPAEVFAFLTDPSLASAVAPNIVSMTSLDEGPMAKGHRMRETRRVGGKESTTDLTVTGYAPPETWAVVALVSGISVTYRFELKPVGEGTHVDLHCIVEGTGLKRMMAPVVAGVMKREDGDHLERLRAALLRAA